MLRETITKLEYARIGRDIDAKIRREHDENQKLRVELTDLQTLVDRLGNTMTDKATNKDLD